MRGANLVYIDRMAPPKCPALVNLLIIGIAILMIVYASMIYFSNNLESATSSSSSKKEGFEDMIAAMAKGAGNPCRQNSDCVSDFCATVDDDKKTCY